MSGSPSQSPIYLDYLATTPICEEASQAMIHLLNKQTQPEGCWGNAGSEHHVYGRLAKQKLESAREKVARMLNASSPKEIYFESGSTETINHAIKGVLQKASPNRTHVVLSSIEHPAVAETVSQATAAVKGSYTVVEPNSQGVVEASAVAQACRKGETAIVTVMLVNNELGSVMNWPAISKAVKAVDPNIILHCDASQGVGKIPVDVRAMGVDLLTVAGHKFYAPKGIGALYIRDGVEVSSLIHGAGHESGRRAGTENMLLAVALGEACEAAANKCLKSLDRTRSLREKLFRLISDALAEGSVIRNGPEDDSQRLPGALSISFTGGLYGSEIARLAGEAGVAFSAGAACHSGQKAKPSKVLKAVGMDDVSALGTIRLSIGRYTTEAVSLCHLTIRTAILTSRYSLGN